MKHVVQLLAFAAFAAAAGQVLAEETKTLMLRSKSAIAEVSPHRSAPFVQPLGEPQPQPLIPRSDPRLEESRSSCASGRDLCYDAESGRIVYKPARDFMPDLPGLQRENISVKRDKIVFKYTF